MHVSVSGIEKKITLAISAAAVVGFTVFFGYFTASDLSFNIGPAEDGTVTQAITKGDVESLGELLEDGADPNESDASLGIAPLSFAAQTHSPDIAGVLLEYGADVNLHDGDEWTPLFDAVTWGVVDTVEVLLDHGADPCIRTSRPNVRDRNVSGMTPVEVANLFDRQDMLLLLEEAAASCR